MLLFGIFQLEGQATVRKKPNESRSSPKQKQASGISSTASLLIPSFYLCQTNLHQIDFMMKSLMLDFFRFPSPLVFSLGSIHYLFITFLMAYVFFLSEVFQYSINFYILHCKKKTTAPRPNCYTVLTGKKSSVKNTSSQSIHSLVHKA